jgi:hypothetical protein
MRVVGGVRSEIENLMPLLVSQVNCQLLVPKRFVK